MKADRRLHRPEWFTKEKYMQLLEEGYRRQEICTDILFVSLSVFERFLDEIDAKGIGSAKHQIRHKRPDWLTFRKYNDYKALGTTDAELMDMMGVSYPVFRRFLDEIGVPRRPVGALKKGETA